jgi:putative ABC transport system substrate-binding protein
VFVGVADPVPQGFVSSLARPGGNLTGFSLFEILLGSKWLELLKQVALGLEQVAVMFSLDTAPYSKFFMSAIATAAPSFGVQASVMPARATADIEPALANFASAPNGGLMLLGDSFAVLRYSLIIICRRSRQVTILPRTVD